MVRETFRRMSQLKGNTLLHCCRYTLVFHEFLDFFTLLNFRKNNFFLSFYVSVGKLHLDFRSIFQTVRDTSPFHKNCLLSPFQKVVSFQRKYITFSHHLIPSRVFYSNHFWKFIDWNLMCFADIQINFVYWTSRIVSHGKQKSARGTS